MCNHLAIATRSKGWPCPERIQSKHLLLLRSQICLRRRESSFADSPLCDSQACKGHRHQKKLPQRKLQTSPLDRDDKAHHFHTNSLHCTTQVVGTLLLVLQDRISSPWLESSYLRTTSGMMQQSCCTHRADLQTKPHHRFPSQPTRCHSRLLSLKTH